MNRAYATISVVIAIAVIVVALLIFFWARPATALTSYAPGSYFY